MGYISDLPEAAKVEETDYIVIESEDGGSRKFPASQLMGGGGGSLIGNISCLPSGNRMGFTYTGEMTQETQEVPVPPLPRSYLYNWDFTQSLTDSVQGQVATLTNASRTSNGVSNNSNSGYVTLLDKYNLTGKTVEIDFTSFSKNTTSGLSRFICANSDSFLGYDANNSRWICRLSNSQQSYSKTSAQNSYNDITMKLVFTSNSVAITVNDGESEIDFYSGGTFAPNMLMNGIGLNIGWSAGGFGLFTITGVRIYDNE